MHGRTRFDSEVVGGLPVISAFLEKLKVAEIVDDYVPWEGDVGLGKLVEILICNRLLNPTAMFRVGDWAEGAAVTDYYGVTKEELNDDRLGRALERLAKHPHVVQAGMVAQAVKRFRLDVWQIHYDVSNVELFGAYTRQLAEQGDPVDATDEAEEAEQAAEEKPEERGAPQPMYGRTKSGRKNVKQIQFGINVSRDGAVPVGHLPFDGNAAEAKTHLQNLQLLRKVLPSTRVVYSADTKLDTDENLLGIAASKGQFLCGGVFQPHLKSEYRKLRRQGKLRDIDYCPQSKMKLPPEERPKYQAAEVKAHVDGSVDGRPRRVKYRLIYVWSETKAHDESQTRARHIAKIKEQFENVERNLNKYTLKSQEAIVKRLEAAKNKYSEGSLFDYQVAKIRKDQFTLSWSINKQRLKELQETEGAYVLKTMLPKSTHTTADVVREYKEQIHVERRIKDLKGRLAVAPMFLEKPERMAGLLCILVWALMIMALMERAVRRNLKGKPMYGLYPENRPSPAPTGTSILNAFSNLCVVIIHEGKKTTRQLAELNELQNKLLRYLDIPPNHLTAFKKKCEDLVRRTETEKVA